MPSTFFGLTIGKTGLYAAQAAINTTAHNAANATTDGYTRQVVTTKASTPISVYSTAGMAGTGVDVIGVERIRNEYYDNKYRACNTECGNYGTKEYYLDAIQNYFNEMNGEGVTAVYTDFCLNLKDLKNNVADPTVRTEVTEFASTVTEYINYLSNSLQSVQTEANTDIKTTVERINSIAAQVAVLNKQINTLEIQGRTANDLRDQRDVLIDELSEYANINVIETNRGDDLTVLHEYVIKLDGKTLVDTYNYNTLQVRAASGSINQNDIEGLYEVTWSDGQDFSSSSKSLGGKLQALFEVRDGNNGVTFNGTVKAGTGVAGSTEIKVVDSNCNSISKLNIPASDGTIKIGTKLYYYDSFTVEETDAGYEYTFVGLKDENGKYGLVNSMSGHDVSIGSKVNYKGVPYYQAQLNEFVRTYAMNFNTIHKSGEDLNGEQGIEFFNGIDKLSGKNYSLDENCTKFSSIVTADGDGILNGSYYNLTAANFCVTDSVLRDPLKVVCASKLDNGVEECSVLDQLIALQDKGDMFKEGTPSEYLESFTANIGIDAQQAVLFATNQSNILASIDDQRMSISSVDTDEEAMNLVKYQHQYELSSKVISVMNEIYDNLINSMGL